MLPFGANECVEDGQNVAAVLNHTRENAPKVWLSLGVLVPFGKHGSGYFDVAPQLFGRMAAEKQAVEKGGFALRKLEVRGYLRGYELGDRGHERKRSLPKTFPASSRTVVPPPRGSQLARRY